MSVKLCKWGNSLGLRISKSVADCLGLQAGDYVFIRPLDLGEILVRLVKARDVHAGYVLAEKMASPKTECFLEQW